MRWRLLAWYAAVLVAVIAGFALTLYVQARRSMLQQIDEQLAGAAEYLDAAIKRLPFPERDEPGRPAFGLGPFLPGPVSLTDAQRWQIEDLNADARARLGEILTPEQERRLEELRQRLRAMPPREPPGPPGQRRNEARGTASLDGAGADIPSPELVRERALADVRLPSALAPREVEQEKDAAYFAIWRPDGVVLKASAGRSELAASPPASFESLSSQPRYRQRGPVREVLQRGAHSTLILVGKPIGRELGELSRYVWRLAGTGCLALAVGLAGGWVISRGIVTPIARIAATAEAISAANLAGRIDTTRLDDELIGLARVLNDMLSRLEAGFSRQARFTADASHELRTPVALLHSQIELALKRERTADEYREALETCGRATTRMRALLEGLLTLSRADAGHLQLAFQPVDMNALVEEAAAQFRADAERGRITLSTELPAAPVVVKGDPVFLSRVLANLLSNAVRHTPENGSIRMSLASEGGAAVLTVADTGCGIPREDQARIFERFFRVDKARSRVSGGSGLGLAICKSIAEAHGGTIGFTSTPDRGTEFTVRIPQRIAAERSASRESASG